MKISSGCMQSLSDKKQGKKEGARKRKKKGNGIGQENFPIFNADSYSLSHTDESH